MLGIAKLVAVVLTGSIFQVAASIDLEAGAGIDLPSPTASQCSAFSSWSDCSDSTKSPEEFLLTPPPSALAKRDDPEQSTDEDYGNALAHQLAQALKRKSVRSDDSRSSLSIASDEERQALLGGGCDAANAYGTCQVAMIRLKKVDEGVDDQNAALNNDNLSAGRNVVERSRSIADPLYSSGNLHCLPLSSPNLSLYPVQRTDRHLREYSQGMHGVSLRAYKGIFFCLCIFALLLIIARLLMSEEVVSNFANSTIPNNATMPDHEQLPRAIMHLYRQMIKSERD